jgi:hypothetical protein
VIMSPRYLSSPNSILAGFQEYLHNVRCPAKSWEEVTVHGATCAHYVYLAMVKGGVPAQSQAMIAARLMFAERRVGNIMVPFVGMNGGIVITPTELRMPTVLCGTVANVQRKEVNFEQAVAALELSRNFRGDNSGERSSFPRVSYCAINVSMLHAELVYLHANLRRFVPTAGNFLVYEDAAKTSTFYTSLASVLAMLDFQGILFVRSTPAMRALVTDTSYTFCDKLPIYVVKEYNYRVVFIDTTHMFTQTFHFGDNCVLFDARSVGARYTAKKMEAYETTVRNALSDRLLLWQSVKMPILSRVPICDASLQVLATEFKDGRSFKIYTGVELHNMIGWAWYGGTPLSKGWYYDVNRDNAGEICAASVVVNVARCTMAHTNYRPCAVLNALGFKVPEVPMRVLVKCSVTICTYDVLDLQYGSLYGAPLRDAFRGMVPSTRAVALRDPEFLKRMTMDSPSPVIDTSAASVVVDDGNIDLSTNPRATEFVASI